jgi:heptosyltransferase-2
VKRHLKPLDPDFSGRILIRQVNWLGDQVMTTPALQRLREKFPKARLVILTPEKLAEVWAPFPLVDQVIRIGRGENVFGVARKIRAIRPNISLVLPNSPRSALESWLAGVPRRVGYAGKWRNWFLTDVVQRPVRQFRMRKRTRSEIKKLIANPSTRNVEVTNEHHQIHDYLRLVADLGADPTPIAPRLWVEKDTSVRVAEKFGMSGRREQKHFALNAGAEYGPAKRWPARRFVEVATVVQIQTNCRWIVLGGPRDATLASEVCAGIGAKTGNLAAPINLAGRTSLSELKAVLEKCQVLLSNDTGPAHVAAALGVPVVIPFGSTSAALTGPGFPGGRGTFFISANVPCAPCFLRDCPIDMRCMNRISAEAVAQAVRDAAARE